MRKLSLLKCGLLAAAFGWLSSTESAWAQAPLTSLNTPYTQDFNTLVNTGTSSILPTGWRILESGTNADSLYVAGTGSSNAGNTYSFGAANSSDRALGGVLSGSLTPGFGAAFANSTGAQITQLQIAYTGEQWRSGVNTGRQDSLIFEYSLNATSLATGTWNRVSGLDFASLNNTVTGALDGNAPANRSNLAATINGLSIAPGATFWVRWSDYNAAGADDGLGVDDFSLTPTGEVVASLTFSPASLSFGNVNLNAADTLAYTVTGSNLEAGITLSASSPYTLSTDSLQFSASATLLANGGKVFVRLAPTTTGLFSGTIIHTSGDLQQNYSVSGTGFDQVSSIIPIAQARTQAVGANVTVAGRITVANQFGGPSYLQDATGGIPVFYFPLSTSVVIGDSVIVTGPIGVFNDQKQISGSGITFTKVETTPSAPAPQVISLSQLAAYEGQLVTIENAEFVNKTFVLLPDNNQLITSGGVQGELRIDGDTDLPGLLKPQSPTNITGVVGRFRTVAQLLPRFREDVPGVTEPTTGADSLSKDKTFDVVTWNVEWFNSATEGPTNDPQQFENVRKIIQNLDADVYAFEEIANDSAFAALTAQLPGYRSFCSDAYSYYFDPTGIGAQYQKICFLYKTATVDSISTKVLLKDLYEGVRSGNTALLPNYPGDPQSFWASGRLPYLFEFNVTIGGQTRRIHLVDIHARANSGTDVSRYDRRKYDVELLKDTLDAQYGSDNVILVGDYNDDVDISVINNLPSSFEQYVQDTLNYRVLTLPLSEQGYFSYIPSGSFLDHIAISDELKDEYLEGSVRIETPFELVTNYVNTTSDHLPVSARFQFAVACTDSVSIIGLPSEVCANAAPITLQGSPAGGTFTVDGVPATVFNPAGVTTGSLIVYNYTNPQNGCAYSIGQVVLVNPAPVAAAGEDKKVYVGYLPAYRTATLNGLASGGTGPYSYRWNTGQTTASIQVSPGKTTTYTLTVTDAKGCSSTDQVTVEVVDVNCGLFGLGVEICYRGHNLCVGPITATLLLKNGATLGYCNKASAAPSSAARMADTEAEILDLTPQLTVAPNPFAQQTTLSFSVPQTDRVSLDVYDAQGRLVQKVFEGQAEGGQSYEFPLDGSRYTQSMYISRLVTSTGVKTVKLIVVK
jgi:hypothetical protein